MLLSKIKCCSVDLKARVHTVIHPNKSLQEKHEVAPFVRERTIIKCALLAPGACDVYSCTLQNHG